MFLLVSSHVPSPSVESAVLCKLFAHFTLCKHFPVLCLFTVTDDKEASSFSRWIRIIGQFFNEFTLKCLKEKPADQAPLCVSPSATPQNTTEREKCADRSHRHDFIQSIILYFFAFYNSRLKALTCIIALT